MTYTPKPGDTVKATLGETTIYGTYMVGAIDSRAVRLEEGPIVSLSDAMTKWDWTFEPWVKPVTFKPLAVVKLTGEITRPWNHNRLIQRAADDEWYPYNDGGLNMYTDEEVAALIAAGKAVVLFEGVEDDTTGTVA